MTRVFILVEGKKALRIKFPKFTKGIKYRLRSILPEGSHVTVSASEGGWPSEYSVAFTHLERLLDSFSQTFDEVHVISKFKSTQVCNESCQTAKHDDCECSCAGVGHKGGRGILGNYAPIIDVEEQTAHRVIYKNTRVVNGKRL